MIDASLNKEEKKVSHLVDFGVLDDHRVKVKKGEKMDFTREFKKMWSMEVTETSIVLGTLGA